MGWGSGYGLAEQPWRPSCSWCSNRTDRPRATPAVVTFVLFVWFVVQKSCGLATPPTAATPSPNLSPAGGEEQEGDAQRPWNTGLRFSKNACRASLASSLAKAMRMLPTS